VFGGASCSNTCRYAELRNVAIRESDCEKYGNARTDEKGLGLLQSVGT